MGFVKPAAHLAYAILSLAGFLYAAPSVGDIDSSVADAPDPQGNLTRLARLLSQLQLSNPDVGNRADALSVLNTATNPSQVRRGLASLLPDVTRNNVIRDRSVNAFHTTRRNLANRHLARNDASTSLPQPTNLAWDQVSWLSSKSTYKPTTDIWLQTWVDRGEQQDQDGFDGFDLDGRGHTVGVETDLNDSLSIGLSLGQATGTVESDIFGKDEQDSDDIGVSVLYASGIHIWSASFKRSRSETERQRLIIINTDAGFRSFRLDADFESRQRSLSSSYSAFFSNASGFALAPYIAMTYAEQSTDDYLERGGGSLNLLVVTDDEQQLVGTIGTNLSWVLNRGRWLIAPSVNVAFERDFRTDPTTTFSRFSDTAASFTTQGHDIEENRWRYAAGVSALHENNFSVSVSFEGQKKGDYSYASAIMNLRMRI